MNRLLQHLLKGLATVAPLLLTVWLLYWATSGLEAFSRPWAMRLLPEGFYIPGMGLLVGLLVLAGLGLLANIFLVQWLLNQVDRLMSHIPLVKSLLSAIKDFAQLLSGDKTRQLRHVVSIELQGMRLVGFVVRESVRLSGADDEMLVAVYFPMSYQIGGYTLYVPRERLTTLDMPLEDAMRMVLTGGASEAPRKDKAGNP
ncbi:MAG: DUF502 domain-containing protein [Gammaproteobacteria bacterium]|nr:DUF502 domain-containing protein [Gammaproteobacteria bacterium]